MSAYLDKILKQFKMEQSKKEFLRVLQGVKLSKTQSPTTAEDRKRMNVIPYAENMPCFVPDLLYTLHCFWQGSTILIQEYVTGQRSRLSLVRTKEIFLDYGGDKRAHHKSYIDASFHTDPDNSKSQSGYILKVGAISQSSSMQGIVDIEYLQNTYGSECDRPVD